MTAVTPIIETERLTLRKPGPQDWPNAQAFYASERSVGVGGPRNEGDAWRAFAMFVGHWDLCGFGLFAITLKDGPDAAIGIAGPFFPAGWNYPEIGWHIWTPEYEGKGIAHEAALATRKFARETLGWDGVVVSNIAYDNTRSMALAERMGAVRDDTLNFPPVGACAVYRHPEAV